MTGSFRHRLIPVLIVLVVVPSVAVAEDYTLTKAINEVLRKNEELNIQRHEIRISRERIDNSIRNFLPDVSLTLREDGSLPDNLSSAYEANLTQPLWTGGRLTGTLYQNQADLRSKRMEYQMIARDIIERVIDVHFRVLRIKNTIQARKKALSRARETRRILRRRRRTGDATELDLLEVKDRMNKIRVGLQQARNNLNQARLEYNRLMKRTVADTFNVVSGRFEVRSDTPPPVTEKRINRTTEELLRNSFRVKHLQAEVDYSQRGLELARSNYYPELNFESQYNASGGETFENNEYEYYLGLNLKMFFLGHSIESNARDRRLEKGDNFEEKDVTVSLFDNNPSSVQTDIDARSSASNDESLKVQNQTAQSRFDNARLRLDRARREEKNRLQSLFYQLETDRLNIVKHRTNFNFQTKKFQVMQRRQDLGEAKPLDLLKTATDRFRARRDLIKAWYSYYQNKLKIDLAAGRIDVQLFPDKTGGAGS